MSVVHCPYVKLEEIGRGGSSKVYPNLGTRFEDLRTKTYQTQENGSVSKTCNDALSKTIRETIQQYPNEIRVLASLQNCEHIIKMIAYDL